MNQAAYCDAFQTQNNDTRIVWSNVTEVLGAGGAEPLESH